MLSFGAFPLHGTARFGSVRFDSARNGSARFAFPLRVSGQCPATLTVVPSRRGCTSDRDCSGGHKCCKFPCGPACVPPVFTKAGECPSTNFGAGTCAELCSYDSDCPNNEKCCYNGCGHQCMDPFAAWFKAQDGCALSQSSPVRPPASPVSSASLPDGQQSAAASVDDADEIDALLREGDSCSLIASGSEDWASSEDPAPPARASTGKRASIEAELMRVLTQATASLGLEWITPEQPAHNRLDGYFLPGERVSPASKPAPFLPELHEEVAKSWGSPFSARTRSSVSLAFSAVDDAKNRGYHPLPPVEEAIAAHLCPPSAGRRAKMALPSKACRTTSALLRRAFSAAGQAASALHTMATLQIYQADLLRQLDESGPDAICVPDLRSATDFALRATKSAAQAIGRSMASLTVSERHLWLTLSDMTESERTAFLDAPVSPAGLFGTSVKDFADRFAEVQKATQAMKHFLPKRSGSAAGRAKPSAQSSQPKPPPAASSSQRRQTQSSRPRSRSSGRRPVPRGPRQKIALKPEAPKSS
ncbi:hypothetical protein PO909_033832 [Leuciscus waleckii]